MKVQAIVPVAGSGSRFNAKQPKSLVYLAGRPLFIHCLQTMEDSDAIDSIILVIPKERAGDFRANVDLYNITKVKYFVEGGRTRCESVANGLKHVESDTDIVLVHDGVRPLIKKNILESAIAACEREDASVVAVPVKSTVKKVDGKKGYVLQTLQRDELWEAQTPQVFKKQVLIEAHQRNTDPNATDDALLVENMGRQVKVVQGDYSNLKVTTPEDLLVAEALLKVK